ncbi:MAG: 16S rRNA (guanine(527)-N(7))-methyltransferase RsmG [Gammaproteobacteria bacterium]|jgi:16S rRNA (guanine527-N7)-methyltransferase|nr:16S rRNA (guanine(527)-N(7))-methyltransferase RsmG [Gammaproteobacteria bacterium]MDA9004391.1 16S rRNA (guanine(527)-N(7))-methyltransferase RsmG [bacterium]MBT5907545.1 16S rRNA (guanine(527)-N(7))-methyltransferase RsmG [Gammaproteobacteria bacterium]MBT6315258.1 16S rRNA (guanine(527)-N(7))-methyltransferase RsmG [Gammaproteobacteria bacterium]MBT6547900.1 16S rRNA (guanine(527)-N(7))-methyltransferase RsmG [Gammaproteobacteria bacterium]
MTDRLEATLEQGLRELALGVPANAQQKLLHYLHLIVKWNKHFNLSGITAIQEMVPLHLLDSLAISPYLEGERILDIGSGAGLPGIPLAIANPDKNFVLLDSNGKKTRFLFQVKVALELSNVEVVDARVDEYLSTPDTGEFSLITCRAFSSLSSIVKMIEKPLASGTKLLAMKGVYPHHEIAELQQDNTLNSTPNKASSTDLNNYYKVESVIELTVPGVESQRHLVLIGQEAAVKRT